MPAKVLPKPPKIPLSSPDRKKAQIADASPLSDARREDAQGFANFKNWRVWKRLLLCCCIIFVPVATIVVGAVGAVFAVMPGRTATMLLIAGIVALVIGAYFAVKIIREICERLRKLSEEAAGISEGRRDSLSIENQQDEIGDLSDAFRRVVETSRRDRDRMLKNNSELQAMNEQLEMANQQVKSFAFKAGEANNAKREFLAVMSHEIRTPVNGIIGMAELASQTELTAGQRDYLDTINSCAESLLVLLNDVLDFSKIEAGKLELERTEFSLRDLLGEALTTLAPRAHNKGLELLLHIRPEVPDIIIGDPHRLRQIVVNLVGNALKFTDKGEILVRVENSKWVEGQAELLFAIADTGIGIPSERLSTIFTSFSQADYSTTRRFGGTGLGLAITQQLVALMSGELVVESELGKGSVFRFSARFGYQKNEATESDPTLDRFKGLRALVLDAHPNSLRITTELLGSWQIKAEPVRDVVTALKELRSAAAAGKPYDLFIADAVRPESPGVKIASTIDSYSELVSTRVVLLVSSPRRGEMDRYRHAAIRATLIKPVTTRSLRVALSKAMEDTTNNIGMSVPKSGMPKQRRLCVLVAEDNAVNQRLAKLNLEGWGHEVLVANDGQEAVDLYKQRPFDIVLMDLQMPNLSGFEATAVIRNYEKMRNSRRTPILALSANVLKGIRDECAKSGMDGYVSKPVRQQELVDAMAGVISDLFTNSATGAVFQKAETVRKEFIASGDAVIGNASLPTPGPAMDSIRSGQVGIAETPEPETVVTPEPSVSLGGAPVSASLFDQELLMSNLAGDLAMLAEVVLLCRDNDAPRLLKDLAAALSKGDCTSAAKAAHGLKGMVGAFNANEAWTAAKLLEASARQGRVEQLLAESDSFVRSLRNLLIELEKLAGLPHQHLGWI